MSGRPHTTPAERPLSPECTLAHSPGYQDIHTACRRLADIPLPYGGGVPLVRRCGCACRDPAAGAT